MHKKTSSGFLAILTSALIYGAYGCLARYLNDSFGYYTQVFFRSSVALLLVGGMLFLRPFTWSLKKKDLMKILLLGISFFAGVFLFTVGSVLNKISVVLFVFYAGSFSTSFIISTLYYHEKLTLQKGLALSLVILGLLITTGLNFSNLGWGLLAAFFSGSLDAYANNLRKQLAGLPKLQVLLLQFTITSLLALLAILVSNETPIKSVTAPAIFVIGVWGLFWVIGNQLIMIGYKHFDFMLAQIVLSSEIFFATVLAFIFFKEMPTMYELIGGVLIFGGVCTIDINPTRLREMLQNKPYKK